MYSKDLYNKFFNFELTFDELLKVNENIGDMEFDNFDSFDKYYDDKLIQSLIDRYKSKKIDDKYFAHWSNVYNWIISTTEWQNDEFKIINCIRSDISETLDAMSFFDKEDEEDDAIERYDAWNKFQSALYKNYKGNITDWNVYYCGYNEKCDDDVPTLFFINENKKIYAELWSGIDVEDIDEKIKMLSVKEYTNKKQELIKLGYIDLFDKQ